MARHLISSGSTFEREISYSRAVVSGSWIFVSGCTGYDYATGQISLSIEDQTEQCFVNIASALREAGASVADVVRVRYMLVDRSDFPRCWGAFRKWFADVRPAATMWVVSGLHTEEMRIEIEVTARRGEVMASNRDEGGLE